MYETDEKWDPGLPSLLLLDSVVYEYPEPGRPPLTDFDSLVREVDVYPPGPPLLLDELYVFV